jgi:penicillin-binding protein 1A
LKKVSNADGISLWEQAPAVQEVTSQQTARTMMRLLREVTRSGTGAAAAALKHPLGGKTGTTSDFTDAWFLGFSPSITCGVWVGYDSRQSLGEKETGAKAALPIWMTFMKAAIAGKDNEHFAGDDAEPAKTDIAQTVSATSPTAAKPAIKPAAPAQIPPHLFAPAPAKPPVAGTKPQGIPGAKQSASFPTATPGAPAKPLVRPAIPQSSRPSASEPAVKPALPQ